MNSRKARKTDPITSYLAAASTTEEALTRIQSYVYAIFKNGLQELTDEDLVGIMESNGYPGTPQAIRTARNELARRGKLEVVGFGKTKTGRKARIWAVA
jgi:hypothetical protein